MYVVVKGGETAVENSHKLLSEKRRGNEQVAEISVEQITQQLELATTRVMAEGSLYDTELASLAIKQARGDFIEAIYLVRAYRATLPRFAYSQPLNVEKMNVHRRVSGTFKDVEGGQILGPTFDYTHRLLDFGLLNERNPTPENTAVTSEHATAESIPRVMRTILQSEDLVRAEPRQDQDEHGDELPVGDITQQPLEFPTSRDVRLQNLARADEGFILGMSYSTMRGYNDTHPFVVELRYGEVAVEIIPDELGFAIEIGTIEISECETVNQFVGSNTEPAQFTRGYGLAFGHNERRVISMALMDRALMSRELGMEVESPAQDEAFILSHSDNTQATGFVEHTKLPHYDVFKGELDVLRQVRENAFTHMANSTQVSSEDHATDKEKA